MVLYIVVMFVDHICKIVCHCHLIQRLGIMLALLLIVLVFLTSVCIPDMHCTDSFLLQMRSIKLWNGGNTFQICTDMKQ